MHRRSLLAVILFFTIAAIGAGLPLSAALAASANPHGGLVDDLNNCPICHRSSAVGTSTAGVKSSGSSLCLSCHGHNADGASTDVEWGILRNQDVGLRSGGFSMAFLDTGMTGHPVLAPTTSSHRVDGTSGTAWGCGPTSADLSPGVTYTLTCMSCHDPHGNGNYRMLRPVVQGSFSTDPVYVAPETSGSYAISYDNNRRDVSYVPTNIGQWCAECHTRYAASPRSAKIPSPDAIFTYRHTSNLPGSCLACHIAHGTSATMGTYSGAVSLPDGTTGRGAADSRLLAVNNRGVCTSCHPK